MALVGGRPVAAGDARHPDGNHRPSLVRLETALIFADGFEIGSFARGEP